MNRRVKFIPLVFVLFATSFIGAMQVGGPADLVEVITDDSGMGALPVAGQSVADLLQQASDEYERTLKIVRRDIKKNERKQMVANSVLGVGGLGFIVSSVLCLGFYSDGGAQGVQFTSALMAGFGSGAIGFVSALIKRDLAMAYEDADRRLQCAKEGGDTCKLLENRIDSYTKQDIIKALSQVQEPAVGWTF